MPQAKILVVDDEPDIRHLMREILEDEGYSVDIAEDGETARAVYAARQPDLVLLDIWMPDVDGITLLKEWSDGGKPACPVVMISGHGTLETAVEATRLGAHDFVQKPLSLAKLLATVKQALAAQPSPPGLTRAATLSPAVEPQGISLQMRTLKQQAQQAARHDSPMLITGEPGSGKETLAAYIHKLAKLPGEWVMLDHCRLGGANVREYLFGSDRDGGQSRGLLESARNGTLFIPGLQILDGDAQALLVMLLEAGRFTPEGGTRSQALECRIIASATGDIEQKVRDGEVLDQLYFRLNVLKLHVPALRERPEDVPELVRFYADWLPTHESLPYRPFSISALNRLRNHEWPGNVRELRNLLQRLLILGGEGEVSVREIEDALKRNAAETPPAATARPGSFDLPLREAREQFEREYLIYQLRKAGGSVGKLSESVGMERTHLYRKLRSLGIDPKSVNSSGGTN